MLSENWDANCLMLPYRFETHFLSRFETLFQMEMRAGRIVDVNYARKDNLVIDASEQNAFEQVLMNCVYFIRIIIHA